MVCGLWKFQLWSRLSEKCENNLRRTVVCGLWCGCGVVVVWFSSDYNTYPSLDFDFDFD